MFWQKLGAGLLPRAGAGALGAALRLASVLGVQCATAVREATKWKVGLLTSATSPHSGAAEDWLGATNIKPQDGISLSE